MSRGSVRCVPQVKASRTGGALMVEHVDQNLSAASASALALPEPSDPVQPACDGVLESQVQRNLQALANPPVGERWFVVHTHPKGEARAEFHLSAQKFRAFSPHLMKTVRHARQLRTVRAPLFPRYIFVSLDLERDRWLSIRSTFGVSSLFMMEGRPVPVPVGVVETLLAATDGLVTRLDDGLAVGQGVRILSGPFSEMVGQLVRFDDGGRVRVLLDLMGGAPVSLPRTALTRLG